MMRPLAPLLSLFALAACGSSPPTTEPAVEVAQQDRHAREQDAKRRDFNAVLIRLDQAMESYVSMVQRQGEMRAGVQVDRIYKLINETVLDTGTYDARQKRPEPGDTLKRLTALATDSSNVEHQAIALAALGFSNREEVMPTILQGAQLSDPYLVDRAVLGLAVLRSPKTPPGVLEAIMLKPSHPDDGRAGAAWALYSIQEASEDPAPFVAVWRRVLTEHGDTLPGLVIVSAVRGLGAARDPANGDLVAKYLKHKAALVRMAAAVAIGRMRSQKHWEDLLALLDPQETEQNVRLCASKALASLSGGIDWKYDVAAWRKVFERGQH
jgi:predicted small lipoprotein YifL